VSRYLFTSERLGFRNWKMTDEKSLLEMNSDPDVMKHFPSVLNDEESLDLLNRLLDHFDKKGFTYFAVELKKTQKFIGFIGLAWQTYEAEFTPCTDIGWRLKKEFWGKGYATEGARRCLAFGFETLKLNEILSVASESNIPSLNVMEKVGMKKILRFDHSKLLEHDHIKSCFLYKISADEFRKVMG